MVQLETEEAEGELRVGASINITICGESVGYNGVMGLARDPEVVTDFGWRKVNCL
jgi:hypothetical protein